MPRVYHDQVVLDDLFIDPCQEEPSRIPYSVQEIFYDMTLAYLIDQPEDPLQFCTVYLQELKKKKAMEVVVADPEPEDVLGEMYNQRRPTVWASDFFMEQEVDEILSVKPKATRVELQKALRGIVLFRHLDQEDINTLIDSLRLVRVEKGDTIIVEGEEGDVCYLVEKGTFSATKKQGSETVIVKTYVNSGFFGELALLYNAPRGATVTAKSDGILWALERSVFRRIVLKKDLEGRRNYEKLIRKVPMLETLTPSEKDKLLDSFETKQYEDGDWIMREGDEGDGMYFVMEGRVVISKADPASGMEVVLNELGEGQFFGEVALVLEQPRAASARALGKTSLAFISLDRFERLLGPCIDIMKRQFESYEQNIKQIFGKIYSMCNL